MELISKFVSFVRSFSFSDWIAKMQEEPRWIIVLVLWVIVAVALVLAFYHLFDYLRRYSVITSALSNLYNNTTAAEQKRIREAYELSFEVGVRDKVPWLERLDNLVLRSGIKKKIKFINTQILLILSVITGVLGMIVGTLVGNFVAWLLLAAIGGSIWLGLVALLANINFYRVEKELLAFANITDNFSKSSDDLIDILDKVSWYVGEPIKSDIRECVNMARYNGDIELAIEQMQLKVAHPKFYELITNLTTASRYEVNYSEIIEDNRKILSDYMRDQKEKAAIYKVGRTQTLAVVVMCVISLYMVGSITEDSLITIFTGSIFGVIISIYFFLVALYAIWVLFLNTKD